MRIILLPLALLCILMCGCTGFLDECSFPRNFSGNVDRIIDGDSLVISGLETRLSLVDTPEYNNPGFADAKKFTETLCPRGSYASVDQDDGQICDKYGRVLAVVNCGGFNLNEEILESGNGRILTEFCGVSEFRSEGWALKHGC